MSIACPTCGYDNNPQDAEFCDACGAELKSVAPTVIQQEPFVEPAPDIVTFIPPEPPPGTASPPVAPPPTQYVGPPSITPPPTQSIVAASARLVAKLPNAPQPEFPLNGPALVGVFDPDSGPVDIDLESFLGGETVSRQHAEIYPEAGGWMVKDLGSTNGVFIKPNGLTRFGARITTPTSLNPGDEVAFGKVLFLFQSP